MTTEQKQAANRWWDELSVSECIQLANKYFNRSLFDTSITTEEEVYEIYAKEEMPEPIKENSTIQEQAIEPLQTVKISQLMYSTKWVANNKDGDLLFTGETREEVEEWAHDHDVEIWHEITEEEYRAVTKENAQLAGKVERLTAALKEIASYAGFPKDHLDAEALTVLAKEALK